MIVVRESFDASFDILKATLKIPSVCSIEDSKVSLMYNKFNQFGFVLVDFTLSESLQGELEELKNVSEG